MTGVPQPWTDLINALDLLSRGAQAYIPTCCSPEGLMVQADPEIFTPDELTQLEKWSFTPSTKQSDAFVSYYFGNL